MIKVIKLDQDDICEAIVQWVYTNHLKEKESPISVRLIAKNELFCGEVEVKE